MQTIKLDNGNTISIDLRGTIRLYSGEGIAEMSAFGGVRFYNKDGRFDRENGPAIIWDCGSQFFYRDGRLHRDESEGPAVITSNGQLVYFWLNKQHRIKGPAVMNPDGTCEYWFHGVQMTKEEHARAVG